MKKQITGIVTNVSNNPFQVVTGERYRTSATLSFDLSFDLCDEGGKFTRVWFFRSFLLPPPLVDGDPVEVTGKYGRILGLIGRKNMYATKILDKKRKALYTAWRNKLLDEEKMEKLMLDEVGENIGTSN